MKLAGKVAIITGGGRGMGREIALAYAEEGADIAVTARTASEIEAVAKEVRALGRRAIAVPAEISNEDMVEQIVRCTLKALGKIDILANTAGGTLGYPNHPVWETDFKEWQEVIDANLTGAFLCARAVAPHMIKRKSGVIINVTSGMGKKGKATFGAYSAAKFGEEGLTEVLSQELTLYNVRVNALQPGGVTATRPILASMDLSHIPVARPDIVRPLAIFLASDESAGITGQSINCRIWNQEHGFGDLSKYLYSPTKE